MQKTIFLVLSSQEYCKAGTCLKATKIQASVVEAYSSQGDMMEVLKTFLQKAKKLFFTRWNAVHSVKLISNRFMTVNIFSLSLQRE